MGQQVSAVAGNEGIRLRTEQQCFVFSCSLLTSRRRRPTSSPELLYGAPALGLETGFAFVEESLQLPSRLSVREESVQLQRRLPVRGTLHQWGGVFGPDKCVLCFLLASFSWSIVGLRGRC